MHVVGEPFVEEVHRRPGHLRDARAEVLGVRGQGGHNSLGGSDVAFGKGHGERPQLPQSQSAVGTDRGEQAAVVFLLRLLHGCMEFGLGEVRIRIIDVNAFGFEERRQLPHHPVAHAGVMADTAARCHSVEFGTVEVSRHALLLPRMN